MPSLRSLVLHQRFRLPTGQTRWTSAGYFSSIRPLPKRGRLAEWLFDIIGRRSQVAYGAVGAMDVCELGRSDSASAPALISRAQQGDQEAFAALFDLHKRHMYSLCLRMTGDIRKAEDAVRQAFVQVFRNLDTFPSEAVFASWLHRVVLDSMLRKLRRPSQASLEEPGASLEHSHGPCDSRNQNQERLGAVERRALARAVQDLPTG